jgi:hypothetical protein
VKICVTAQIASSAVPGWPRTQKQRDKQEARGIPPILGSIVDEGFGDALIERTEIALEHLLSLTDDVAANPAELALRAGPSTSDAPPDVTGSAPSRRRQALRMG